MNSNNHILQLSYKIYDYFLASFVGCLVISQVLASKIAAFELKGIGLISFPAGVVAYAATFAITDVISETWGKNFAKRAVWAGFIVNIIVLFLIILAHLLPSAPFWDGKEAWTKVVISSARITLASLIAYLISQMNDVWLFHLIRNRTGEKFLWLRNNTATFISQLLDTTVFITLAFYGTMPIFKLILGMLIVKWMIALLDTPFVYLGVMLCRKYRINN